jgi:nucleoside-diphosphate-sugar epimerase/intein/homing endonuclease
MPTSLVTGGAGFLGSHLCEALLAKGHRVICLDNLEVSTLENIEHLRSDAFSFVNHDVTVPIVVDEPVDVVYHLAALASPIDYMRLPLHSLKTGSYGTHHALGLAKWKRARFLLASTSEVYGDPEVHPQPETYWGNVNPIGPRGVYDEAKRYAEALTMAYHRQQGVDTAIVRIFNSILEDEQILVDDGRELRRLTVGEYASELVPYAVAAGFVPSAMPRSLGVLDSGPVAALEYPLEDVRVPAFGEDGSIVAAKATSLVAHPSSSPCYEITTRYGRSIRVTGDHSLFVEGSDGAPVARAASELATGDRVAIARRVRVPERDRETVSLLDAWTWAENDPWELSVEADGLGALAWENRFDLFGLLVSERRNNGPNWRNGAWTRLIRMRETNRVPLPVLRRLGVPVPAGARVRRRTPGRSVSMPASVSVTDSLLWLLGLWVAEGSWHRSAGNAFITISCDSPRLDRAEAIVRDELGLHVVRAPGSSDRAPALFVHSFLLLQMLEYLGFANGAKCIPGWILGLPLGRLKWFLEGYREGDGVHSGLKLAAGKRHEFSTVSTRLKNDLVVALGRFGLVPSVGRYESSRRAKTGVRAYPFWRLTLAHVSPWSPLEWDRGVEQRLNARTVGDLVWATVTGVEEIEATPLVYDFSVPGYENFWAGTGLMAHNTYGPRMRPNDGRAIPTFIRQALDRKPLTVFGDGSQTRSFCYVDDLIRGVILLVESNEHMPVNIGNPGEYTILELAEAVLSATGSSSTIVFEALPVDDPQVRQPDITRARQLLGWEPEVSLEEGLRRTLASLEGEPARA